MLIMQDVNTPSQVPNSTGSHTNSWLFHQGWRWASSPWKQSTQNSASSTAEGQGGTGRGVGRGGLAELSLLSWSAHLTV